MIAIRVESSCFHTSRTSYAYTYLQNCPKMTYSLFHTTFLFPAVGNNFNCTNCVLFQIGLNILFGVKSSQCCFWLFDNMSAGPPSKKTTTECAELLLKLNQESSRLIQRTNLYAWMANVLFQKMLTYLSWPLFWDYCHFCSFWLLCYLAHWKTRSSANAKRTARLSQKY